MVYSTMKVVKNQGKTSMAYDGLRDLCLAGIKWEISDIPLVRANMPKNPNDSGKSVSANDTNNTVHAPTSVVPPIAPSAPISVDMASSIASRPTDINALNRMICEFKHPLRATATNVVPIHNAPNPNGLMILTDIPSADDDANGSILTGTAGEMMDKMLNAIGMSRDMVSIMPMIFWRTPGGRTPSREEIDLSRPFVNRAIQLLAPRIILTLGTLPATEVGNINLGRDHGIPVTLDSGTIVVPIYHPNYLILKPASKRDVWNALQNVQKLLKSAEI